MLPVTLGLGLINFDLRHQLDARLARLRPGAARDRRGVPHLHAAAGHVQRRAGDGAVPDARAARRAPRPRRPARARGNGMRQIALLLIPARGDHARARDADRAARLPARRVRRRLDRAGRPRRCSGSRFSLPFSRRQPAAHAHVLLAPAAVARDRARGRRRWSSTSAVSLALYGPFGIAGIVLGTVIVNAALTVAQARLPAARAARPRGRAHAATPCAGCSSPRAVLGVVAYGVWYGARRGARALAARRRSCRSARAGGRRRGLRRRRARRCAIPEAHQIRDLVARQDAARRS